MITIKRGLDLPIDVKPPENDLNQVVDRRSAVKTVALLGRDYVGMRPTLAYKKGETVQKGTPLFSCKKTNGVVYTAPLSGKIVAVNRGARRMFQSIVVASDGREDEKKYTHFSRNHENWNGVSIRELLIETGLWTAIRQRPFSKVPAIDARPKDIFITAMDTNPLMYNPEIIIDHYMEDFLFGAFIFSHLTQGKVFVCTREDTSIDLATDDRMAKNNIELKQFAGIHPAGNPGTHIHFLSPNSLKTTTWYIGFQDVIAVGKLFKTGSLWTDRYVAMARNDISAPWIYKTKLGASITDFITGQDVDPGAGRVISGSVLNGFDARGPLGYLGRFSNQISVISNHVDKELFGWMQPGFNKFSIMPTFISRLLKKTRFSMNTAVNGSPRAMVPIGAYEKVMPLDTLPTQLLRALLVKDTDMAMDLGALDLDEEDLALCTYVDPGKVDYGPVLRDVLTLIEAEEM